MSWSFFKPLVKHILIPSPLSSFGPVKSQTVCGQKSQNMNSEKAWELLQTKYCRTGFNRSLIIAFVSF